MKKKGFTLIELIVSIAIVSILALLISSILSVNFSASNKLYNSDKSHKHAINAMLFIENVVREADEIRPYNGVDKNQCNFIASIWKGNNKRNYRFYVKNNTLYDNISKVGSTNNRLQEVKDIKLVYDKNQTVEIEVISLDGQRYSTFIDLGVRP